MTLRNARFLLLAASLLTGCQPAADAPATAAPPAVGHYQGTLQPATGPALPAALDIRHPAPGRYEAELTVPAAPGLNFVADLAPDTGTGLRLARPGRRAQTLALALDGDFWRGTLTLDSTTAAVLLVRRGGPAPSAYRTEEFPQPGGGTAWLLAPADTGTPGPALALLPDAATAAAAPLWADALARNGCTVLLLPPADSALAALPAALRLLRRTPGADPATVGAWLAGGRALAFARAAQTSPATGKETAAATSGETNTAAQATTQIAPATGPQPAFLVLQNLPTGSRAAWQTPEQPTRPLLGLAAGPAASRALRQALPRRRGTALLTWPGASPDLLVPGPLGPNLAPEAVAGVVQWLRGR